MIGKRGWERPISMYPVNTISDMSSYGTNVEEN